MRIIPVLDLKDDVVVRAEQGRRDRYKPIVTPLSASADPVDIAHGLRSLHPFPVFYIADLDAIAGGAANRAALLRLKAMPDAPELWVDAGVANAETLTAALGEAGICPVLGSESQHGDGLLGRFRDHPRLILSLDFFADGFRGPASFLDRPELWPQQVIVMTLAKVGSGAGPDVARLKEVIAKAGDRSVIAAGGVRNEGDIRALIALGAKGALVATSLHDGTLTPSQLKNYAS